MGVVRIVLAIGLTITPLYAAAMFIVAHRRLGPDQRDLTLPLALALAPLVIGRILGIVDLTVFDGPGQPLWLSPLILPTAILGSIVALTDLRRRDFIDESALRFTALIISLGVFGIIWNTAANDSFDLSGISIPLGATIAAHVIVDFFLLASVLTLGAFASRLRGRPTRLIALGVIFYTASDLSYILETSQGTFDFVSWTVVGYVVGPLLVGVAARLVANEGEPNAINTDLVDTWSLTYIPLLVLCVLLTVDLFGALHNAIAASMITAMVVLMIARIHSYQTSVGMRHRRMSRDLDIRQRELQREKVMIDRIVEVAGDGIVAIDGLQRVTLCNAAAREILGLGETAPLTDLHALFHGDRQCPTDCVATAFSTGMSGAPREFTIHTNRGPVVIDVSYRPFDGPGSGAVLVFRDVTDRVRLNETKTRIVSVVSHEIRTPLTSIRGSLGLIKGGLMGPINDEASRMISIAIDSSERLMRLIDDLLDVERIGSGRRSLNLSSVPLNILFDEIVTTLFPIADMRSVGITVDSSTDIVELDRDRITQVITNLVQNAIKFSEPGSNIHLSSSCDDDNVTITVRDEGHGIPHSHIDSIFEPFHQVDTSDSGPSSGSGLGLAICKEIVELHGGRIWAERGVEHGAIFRFRIPRRSTDGGGTSNLVLSPPPTPTSTETP